MKTIEVFDCPVHGLTTYAYCWRVFDPRFKDRHQKFVLIPYEDKFDKYEEMVEELRVTNRLLDDCRRVLDAIPACPIHHRCIPHALDWVEGAREAIQILTALLPKGVGVYLSQEKK